MTAQSPNVLVVDDEQGILDVIRILLANNGFTPHTAHGGKAALEAIERVQPDIVISDIRMPGITGVEVLAAARAADPETPVILMTAQATLQSAVQAVNEGAFYYIQKPFRNDDLLAIVRRASREPAGERAVRAREGVVHGGGEGQDRPVRGRVRRNVLPRRGRRDGALDPGEAPPDATAA